MLALVKKYFPALTASQLAMLEKLPDLYKSWNEKINVISRKDIDNLEVHHILHSLSIACFIQFQGGSRVMDAGTGGGFPGIPLAILFPNTEFHLVDSIGKKARVAAEIAASLSLNNVTVHHQRMESVEGLYDFIMCRAVTSLKQLESWTRKRIGNRSRHEIKNGWIVLKGGDLNSEIQELRKKVTIIPVSTWIQETYMEGKYLLYFSP